MSKKNDEADVRRRSNRADISASTQQPATAHSGGHEKHRDETTVQRRTAGPIGPALEKMGFAAFAALDQLSIGVAIVDLRCHVVWANTYCHEILAAGDGLSAAGGVLHATSHEQSARLNRLVGVAGADCEGRADETGVMTLSRPSGTRPYLVAVRQLGHREPASHGYAAIFITDPQREMQLDAHRIAALFDLTRSESQLAARIAAGRRLDHVAAELGVATGTARTHLKHIFQKTETGRQSELSQLLRALLGKLRWS